MSAKPRLHLHRWRMSLLGLGFFLLLVLSLAVLHVADRKPASRRPPKSKDPHLSSPQAGFVSGSGIDHNESILQPKIGRNHLLLTLQELPVQTRHDGDASTKDIASGICDVTVGKWVQDDAYPLYKPGSCPYVHERYNCYQNGRPDLGYTKWRWKPKDCQIPRFNATILLETLRRKRLIFVGDSLNRNQAESMMCLLREGLPDRSRLLEIYMEPDDFAFKFLDYDCMIEFHRSNFLVDVVEERFKDAQGRSVRFLQLDRIDKIERLTNWSEADVLIFNTGHWWNHWKTTRGKIKSFRDGANVYQKLDLMIALRKAMKTWAAWVDSSVNITTKQVFFSGFSPIHFRGGSWNTGGGCRNETQPVLDRSRLATKYPPRMVVAEEVIKEMKVPLKILNVSRLSDFRQDAHPSVYGHRPEQKRGEDCSHWCLPGVPDLWNEILFAHLISSKTEVRSD